MTTLNTLTEHLDIDRLDDAEFFEDSEGTLYAVAPSNVDALAFGSPTVTGSGVQIDLFDESVREVTADTLSEHDLTPVSSVAVDGPTD